MTKLLSPTLVEEILERPEEPVQPQMLKDEAVIIGVGDGIISKNDNSVFFYL
jgi:hypothetical protein